MHGYRPHSGAATELSKRSQPLWAVEENSDSEMAATAQSWLKTASRDGGFGARRTVDDREGGNVLGSPERRSPFRVPTATEAGAGLGGRSLRDYSKDSLEGSREYGHTF